MSSRLKLIGSLLLLASFTVIAETRLNNKPQNTPLWSPTDQDIRILEIRVGYLTLEEIVAAYQYQDVILIPLGALSENIDIAIDSRPEKKLAQGFIFKTERTFHLDTERNEVTIQGIAKSYQGNLVQVLLDDIYVESNLLSEWLGIQLSVNLFSSQLWITSDEPLPFQKRLEREKNIARTLSRIKPDAIYYPRHYQPYKNTSSPFIDLSLRTGINRRSDGSTDLTYNHTTHLSADLLKLESQWYMAGSDQDVIDDFRVTLGRKDPESRLLGPLKATEFTIGHIFEPRVNLVTQPTTLNPGVSISNFKTTRQLEYDRQTFHGELLPNWEVEIYHNNSLIGYQSTAIEGQYLFEDIPLLYGSNHFRLVFYGPQGQIIEENSNYQLGDSLTKPGEQHYRASLIEDDKSGNRIAAQYNIGLHKNLSASFHLTSIPLEVLNITEQHDYIQLGIRSFFKKYFFNIDSIKDTNGGSAIDLGMQTGIYDTILGFNHTTFNDFISEELRPTGSQLSDRTSLSINSSITSSFLPRIPFGFEILKDNFTNNTSLSQIINQLSLMHIIYRTIIN